MRQKLSEQNHLAWRNPNGHKEQYMKEAEKTSILSVGNTKYENHVVQQHSSNINAKQVDLGSKLIIMNYKGCVTKTKECDTLAMTTMQ